MNKQQKADVISGLIHLLDHARGRDDWINVSRFAQALVCAVDALSEHESHTRDDWPSIGSIVRRLERVESNMFKVLKL